MDAHRDRQLAATLPVLEGRNVIRHFRALQIELDASIGSEAATIEYRLMARESEEDWFYLRSLLVQQSRMVH